MDNFELTSDDIYLIVKSIGHTVESDCDCFTTSQLIQAGELLGKLSKIPMAETQFEIEERIRIEGEP